ncbi:hypothetical protein [Rhizobacter sp. P5_C2]
MTSANDKDVAWLEAAQLEEFAKLGLSAPNRSDEDPFRTSSRYDHPFLQTVFGELANQLEKIIGWQKLPYERPLLGEWPGHGTNAFVLAIPGRPRYAILFQPGLLEYIRIAVGAFVAAVPLEAVDDGVLELSKVKWDDPSTADHVYDKYPGMLEAVAGALLGDYGKARVIVQNLTNQPRGVFKQSSASESDIFGSLLCQIYAFILAHEYGHILEDAGILAFRTEGTFADQDEARAAVLNALASISSEMNADLLSVGAVMRLGKMGGIDIATSYAAVHIYFTLMHLLEAAADVMVTGAYVPRSPLSTHPPQIERRKYCLSRTLLEIQDCHEREKIEGVVNGIQELSNMLWVGISYVLKQWHIQGAQDELLPQYRNRLSQPT